MKFEDLNPRQKQAASHVDGPMLVVAGAGTGKTTVLTQRVAKLIRDRHAPAGEVLAITYTDKAAAELAERVTGLLLQDHIDANALRPTTFHAYCYGILKRAGKDFRVILREDLWVYLRQRFSDLPLHYYTRASSPGEFLHALLDFFDQCHDELRDVNDYERFVEDVCAGKKPLPRVLSTKKSEGIQPDEVKGRCREIAAVFRRVEEMLAAENLGTFGHMIYRAHRLLRDDPTLLAHERQRARFILVDEFQDCNVAQIELVQMLAGDEQNIFVVGDPDQAIYKFRGASSAAFEEFAARFPGLKVTVLTDNLRSSGPILGASYAVISDNPSPDFKFDGQKFTREPLVSVRDQLSGATSELMHIALSGSDYDEAVEVAETIKRLRSRRIPKSQTTPLFGVLYRQHNHRERVVRELALRDIPIDVKGIDVLESAEIRDLMAALRAVQHHDGEGLLRLSALPCFDIDAATLRAELSTSKQPQMESVLERVPSGKAVLAAVDSVRVYAKSREWKLLPVVQFVIKQFNLPQDSPAVRAFLVFVSQWSEKPTTRKGDLAEFLACMTYWSEAGGTIPLIESEHEAGSGVVRLMTVHAAKGLEFEHVFVLRANSGAFPANYRERLFEYPRAMRHERSLSAEDGKELNQQEERRLFYVAMTRARQSLTIIAKPRGKKNPNVTGFVRELTDKITARKYWDKHPTEPHLIDIAASAGSSIGLASWLQIPPSPHVYQSGLSASAVEMYEACPLQFKINRDWRIPGEVSASLHFGRVMHDVLKAFYDAILAGRPITHDQLFATFGAALADAYFDDADQRELYRREGEKQLRMFVEREPASHVISTEESFTMKVGSANVRGRIDRMDQQAHGTVSITDYKTGSPKDQRYADESLQLSIYALATRRNYQREPGLLVIHNLADDTQVSTTRDEKQLLKTEERILTVAENIAKGNFEAKPDYTTCRFCAYRRLCPETEQEVHLANGAAAAVTA